MTWVTPPMTLAGVGGPWAVTSSAGAAVEASWPLREAWPPELAGWRFPSPGSWRGSRCRPLWTCGSRDSSWPPCCFVSAARSTWCPWRRQG